MPRRAAEPKAQPKPDERPHRNPTNSARKKRPGERSREAERHPTDARSREAPQGADQDSHTRQRERQQKPDELLHETTATANRTNGQIGWYRSSRRDNPEIRAQEKTAPF